MDEKKFSATNQVVFTQQCESGARDMFDDFYNRIVEYADKNKLEKPKKQHLLTRVLRNGLLLTPEEYFNN